MPFHLLRPKESDEFKGEKSSKPIINVGIAAAGSPGATLVFMSRGVTA